MELELETAVRYLTRAEELRAVAIYTRGKRKQEVLLRAADKYEHMASGGPPKAPPPVYDRWRGAVSF